MPAADRQSDPEIPPSMNPSLPQQISDVVASSPMGWTAYVPLVAAFLSFGSALLGAEISHRHALRRETHLRVWQAKRETYMGAITALTERRTAQANLESLNVAFNRVNEAHDDLQHRAFAATSADDRRHLEDQRDLARRQIDALFPQCWEGERKLFAANTAVSQFAAKLKLDGTPGTIAAYRACRGVIDAETDTFDSAFKELIRCAEDDLGRYQLHSPL